MLLNASGCLDALTAPETARQLDAFVTKTVTPLPRGGNAPVRIAETDVGMLNSIGLANPGRERFLAETLPRLRELGLPLWVSVGGFSAHEYAETCARLEDVTIELNLSCPNVDEAPESAAEIVAACRAATALPLYAKLSPASWDVGERRPRGRGRRRRRALARQHAARDGARRRTSARCSARRPGGCPGPALKPVALAAVHACFRATSLPIVGMGGVATGRDALELLAAGARPSRSAQCSSRTRPRRPGSGTSSPPNWPRSGSSSAEEACGIAHQEALPKENTSI